MDAWGTRQTDGAGATGHEQSRDAVGADGRHALLAQRDESERRALEDSERPAKAASGPELPLRVVFHPDFGGVGQLVPPAGSAARLWGGLVTLETSLTPQLRP